MEKFSAFRDPGTGIQPFLSPVPPSETDVLATAFLPIRHLIGTLRTSLVLVLALVYLILVRGVCLILTPIPSVSRTVTRLCTALLARLALCLIGFWWIPAELVTRKRGKAPISSWRPAAGDLIVSNWVSWVEILWLAYRYDPIFVLPVSNAAVIPVSSTPGDASISYTPGRRTGTGSAAISSSQRVMSTRRPILGFKVVSLLSMIRLTGQTPQSSSTELRSIEEIRRSSDRPLVIFPECTTSNGRGLLRFAAIFKGVDVPPKGYNIFVMCVRYDPPSSLKPTLSYSVPSTSFTPLRHLYNVATALPPQSISIRLLSLSDSPSSQLFMVSEVVPSPGPDDDVLSEACAVLIAQIGKMKRVGLGWEDKAAFLDFYRGRAK
ncbi:hypothetical protein BV22DRAFT_1037467 [Leucogyrophana mollusca]|uniref:Uncharacterized protein n=1 Tax=Leucogyrophana mollusca TaxID=85980 RepID=A0ACB8BB21_9AGAM|nr:hypothetical protein BV22DRAFT_1037467 [Leucogyrophana mollusca]